MTLGGPGCSVGGVRSACFIGFVDREDKGCEGVVKGDSEVFCPPKQLKG